MEIPTITDKQISFIERLSMQVGANPLERITEILGRDVTTYNDLNRDEISRIIANLKNDQPLSFKQMNEISAKYTIEEINKIFKRRFQHHGELTFYNYKILTQDRFKVMIKNHPLEVTIDYEYGWQETDVCPDGKFYYLKFYDLMMMDYDEISYEGLMNLLMPWTKVYTFKIYRTHNGYHVYIVSELINHINAEKVMPDFKCDFWYMKFAVRNGYKIRLTRKLGRAETFLEEYVETIGDAGMNPDIEKLLEIHDKFLAEAQLILDNHLEKRVEKSEVNKR